jgi:hypothetical protein
MLSNRLAFAALAIACLGAAAGGGYLATRQNTVPTPASAQVQPASTAPASAASPASAQSAATHVDAGKAVQETEGVIGNTPRASVPAAKPNASRKPESTTASAATRQHPAATNARQEPLPSLTSSWPAGAAQPPAPVTPAPVEQSPSPKPEERAPEPARAPEPPAHQFEELVVSADSVLGLQTETRVTSETARVEDKVEARVTRDVRVGGRVAIPAGAKALGSVTMVERGGKIKDRAKLAVKFHTLVLADGTKIPISTDPIYREGEAPGASSSSKIGGAAVGGAILGAILGGSKGMAIGAAAGAGAGTAVVQAGDRNAAVLAAGSPLTVRILQPVTVTTDVKN